MSLPKNSQVADTDGDGLLDQDEFKQLFDLDGDGQVDAKEQAKAMKLFAMVDKARACPPTPRARRAVAGAGRRSHGACCARACSLARPRLSRGSRRCAPQDGDGQLTTEELKQLAHAGPQKFKARNA